MDEQFVRVHAGNGYLTIERGIPTAFCGQSFPIDDDGYVADDDLHEIVKLLHQAWGGELWEGIELEEASKVAECRA